MAVSRVSSFWLIGESGTEDIIARLIAAEVADPFLIEELDAAALTVAYCSAGSRNAEVRMGRASGRAYLINEAHASASPSSASYSFFFDRIPRDVVIVFTTTCEGKTRCSRISRMLPPVEPLFEA